MTEQNREPLGRLGAGVYALLVHLVLIAFLVLSFRWGRTDISYVLRSNPHVIHAFMVGPLPNPRLTEPLPPAPRPIPHITPHPAPTLKPKAVPRKGPSPEASAKAQAKALQAAHLKALEQARAEAHLKAEAKAEAMKARAQALALAKARAQAALKKAALARAQQQAAEARAALQARAALARQVAAAVARAKAKAAAESAARGIVDRYKALIKAKVSAAWVSVPGAKGLRCDVAVHVIAGGQVLSVRIVRSSGNAVFDRSVVSAIYNAAPLPVPRSPAKLRYLSRFHFVFRAPKGSSP